MEQIQGLPLLTPITTDFIGAPVEVGTVVAIKRGDSRYDTDYEQALKVGVVLQVLPRRLSLAFVEAKKIDDPGHWSSYTVEMFPHQVARIHDSLDPTQIQRIHDHTNKRFNFSEPGDVKSNRRYVVGQYRKHDDKTPYIGIFELFGTTEADLQDLDNHISQECKLQRYMLSMHVGSRVHTTRYGDQWSTDVYRIADRLLSKKKLAEAELVPYINTIMTMDEFNRVCHPDYIVKEMV